MKTRRAVCFCGFLAEGPWYRDEAREHANDNLHLVEIVEGSDEFVEGVLPTIPLRVAG